MNDWLILCRLVLRSGAPVVEIRILGPIEVWHDGAALRLPRRQQRVLLGSLALAANTFVSFERLVALLWGDEPPTSARAVVQSRISELRAALGKAMASDGTTELATHNDGYLLRIQPDRVDSARFRALAQSARLAGDDQQALMLLRQALDLWRGPVLGGWSRDHAQATTANSLESARLTAVENLAEIEIRLGHHHRVVDELLALSALHPTRGRLVEYTMRALHRSGRTGEALEVYVSHQRWLTTELGIDPGTALRQLYLDLLRAGPDTPEGLGVAGAQSERGSGRRTPCTLPPGIADFTGRAAEVSQLAAALTREGPAGPPIVALTGPGGVGKTILAVHVAHALRGAYPDGQLFCDLHSLDDDGPAQPIDLLGRLLLALDVPESRLPARLDERLDLYRAVLSERRVLLVLDNASSDAQLRPLIPGSRSSAVLTTSRARLGAAIGAQSMALSPFGESDSIRLLARLIGPARVCAEPSAPARLAAYCAYLPLAVRVAGIRLAENPQWSVAHLTGMLADQDRRLDLLAHGDLDVRAAIAASYRSVSGPARDLLGQLSRARPSDVDNRMVAGWAGVDPLQAADQLDELCAAHLVEVARHGEAGEPWYRLPDLIRLFVREAIRAAGDGGASAT